MTGLKKIIFIRHGQYKTEPERLTVLGRQQATVTARRLKKIGLDQLYCSTMPRAKETAKIVSRSVNLKPQEMDFFCESLLPVEKKQMVRFKNSKSSKQELNKLVRRMGQNQKVAKAAFKLLFAKPVRGNKTIGVVAHGNVIRFWLCLALNISGKKWLDFDLTQCSITTIRIDKSGNIMVLGFADCGHLKKSQQTYI